MLGRFVIPAARLAKLSGYLTELFAAGPPLGLAVLGRSADSVAGWAAAVAADVEAISAFQKMHGSRASIDAFEVRLPPDATDADKVSDCVAAVTHHLPDLDAFFEAAAQGEDHPSLAAAVVEGIARGAGGFKLRCGGATAAAFPSAQRVAAAFAMCHDEYLSIKLTAGLHHPLPRTDPATGARMHGFVNMLLAGVFTSTERADDRTTVALLEDADPSHFQFGDGIAWGGLSATPEEVAAERRSFVLSFGSCSFDEPREDLRALGWLQE
jgi:hypothetical protein